MCLIKVFFIVVIIMCCNICYLKNLYFENNKCNNKSYDYLFVDDYFFKEKLGNFQENYICLIIIGNFGYNNLL